MNECIPVEEIGALAQLPDDDPRRRHAAACPRCSALLFAYEEFVRAQDVEGADATDAEARLSKMIEARVEGVATASGATRRERGTRFSFPLLRTAAVAAMVVVGVVALLRWQPWATDEIVYRGDTRVQISGLVATSTEHGMVELRWNPVSGADSYRVTMLAEDLTEMTRSDVTEPAFHFDRSAPGRSLTPRYWQVTALLEGGEILTSDPQPLP